MGGEVSGGQRKKNFSVESQEDKNEGNEAECHHAISGGENIYQFSRKVLQVNSEQIISASTPGNFTIFLRALQMCGFFFLFPQYFQNQGNRQSTSLT